MQFVPYFRTHARIHPPSHCLISFMSMFMFCYAPKRKFTTLTAFLRPGANVPHAHARHAHTHARASAPLPTRPHAPPI